MSEIGQSGSRRLDDSRTRRQAATRRLALIERAHDGGQPARQAGGRANDIGNHAP
jgi:hypothetical protein